MQDVYTELSYTYSFLKKYLYMYVYSYIGFWTLVISPLNTTTVEFKWTSNASQ